MYRDMYVYIHVYTHTLTEINEWSENARTELSKETLMN